MGSEDIKSEIRRFLDLEKNEKEEFAYKIIETLEKYKHKNIFITLEKYEKIVEAIKKGKIVYSVKDNIVTKNFRTTAGSLILKDYYSGFDAYIIRNISTKLNGEVIGKTNMDEFGFGTFGINSAYGITKNAFDNSLVSGGSSSGSGVYSQIFPFFSVAESTGGSITSPAAFNGIIGFTPTYGLISRFGLISYANSLDKIGFFTRNPYDLELLVKNISKDERDPTNHAKLNRPKKISKIAIIREMTSNNNKQFYNFINRIQNNFNIQIDEVSFKELEFAIPCYYIISTAEASTNLNKFCGLRYSNIEKPWLYSYNDYFKMIRTKYFGEEAKRRIILGTFVRMYGFKDKYYIKALKVRTSIINGFKQILNKYDAIAAPSMPIKPLSIKKVKKLKPIQHYMIDKLTIPPNLAGLPQLSYPISIDSGVQFITDHYNDLSLIEFSKQLYEIKAIKYVKKWF